MERKAQWCFCSKGSTSESLSERRKVRVRRQRGREKHVLTKATC